jgi:hypothetical protein
MKCEFCKKEYKMAKVYQKHVLSCKKQPNEQCAICGASIPKIRMEEHVRTDLLYWYRKCKFCDKFFANQQSFDHFMSCDGFKQSSGDSWEVFEELIKSMTDMKKIFLDDINRLEDRNCNCNCNQGGSYG